MTYKEPLHSKLKKNPREKPGLAVVVATKKRGIMTMCATEGFSLGFSLLFFVNIMCSAERSSAYCYYSSFLGRHHHSIFTPRYDIEYQKNTDKYPSLMPVLWRHKTWNNVAHHLVKRSVTTDCYGREVNIRYRQPSGPQ